MQTEPVLTIGAIAAAIVAAASIFNVAIDLDTVTTILVVAVPLIGSLLARGRVTPV